ncbi:MAG: glycosyl transferase family 39 [Pseudomonadota bacterium]
MKHLITVLFLVAAIFLYAMGLGLPATGLVFLAMLAEGVFWYRLMKSMRRKPAGRQQAMPNS